MELKRLIIFWIIILFITSSAIYTFTVHNKKIENKVSTQATAEVEIIVQQVCGDTYCNDPETCSSCTADCGTCPATPSAASGSAGGGGGGGGGEKTKQETPEEPIQEIPEEPITEDYESETAEGEKRESLKDLLLKPRNLYPILFASAALIFAVLKIATSKIPALKRFIEYKKKKITVKKSIAYIIIFLTLVLSGFIYLENNNSQPDISVSIITSNTILKPGIPLSDISINVLYPKIETGKTQIVTTKITNEGSEEAKNFIINYILWNKNKQKIITESSETVVIQTSIRTAKEIYIPEDIPSGDYVIEVNVEQKDTKLYAKSNFIVINTKEKLSFENKILLLFSVLLSSALLTIIALLYSLVKLTKKIKKN